MSERQYREKEEKEEKQEEKEEKQKEEKSWDEKWRRDPLNAAVWAVIIIWAGLVLLVNNLGLFDRFKSLDAWSFIFFGAGLILLLEVGFRQLMPAYRQPVMGSFVLAVVFLAIGLGGLVGWDIIWALALIVVGLGILLRGLLGRR
jgi:cation transport ATPase